MHIRASPVLPLEGFANFLQHLKVTLYSKSWWANPLRWTCTETGLEGTKGEDRKKLAILVGAYGDLGGDSGDREETKV